MKRPLRLLVVVLLFTSCNPEKPPAEDPPPDEWISLFNGTDLDGWTVKLTGHDLGDNYANTFRVEDGLLKVSYDGYDRFYGKFGHIFYKDNFSHYRLRLEYRFVGEQIMGGPGWALRNSGIMVHGQAPETMTRDQDFPVSIEVQLLGDDGSGERPTANLCSPGTHVVMGGELITQHCVTSNAETFPPDEWVTVEVEVRGNTSIRHIVNGELVLEYGQPQLDEGDPDAQRLLGGGDTMLHEGSISLQSESHPIEFRNIELLLLDEDAGGR